MPLLRPEKIFHRVTDITPEYLKSIGVKGLALDADNTLSTHHSQTPLENVEEWLAQMVAAGIKLQMVSNSKDRRCRPFAERLGLEYTCVACKPLPFGFWRARRKMGLKGREFAAVGDQLFTDMLGANLAGVTPLLVEPILLEDGWSFKVRRRLEAPLLCRYRGEGR